MLSWVRKRSRVLPNESIADFAVPAEGYDTILIGNFYAYPTFSAKYGTYFPEVGYQLTAAWQAGLGNASGVGAFFGVLLNGYLVGIYGQKRVLLGSLIVLSGFIFMTFFAPNIIVLTAGEVLCGYVVSGSRVTVQCLQDKGFPGVYSPPSLRHTRLRFCLYLFVST